MNSRLRSSVLGATTALAFVLASVRTARADDASASSRSTAPGASDGAADATEIVVKAPAREVPGTTTQVLREPFLERSGATNVGQALEMLPTVFAASDSRGERVLSLQGFTQRQVAVFVDGIPVLVPYDGQLDLSKFPIDMIDRITVVKGSAPTLYGPNGLGGAINLSTREPRENLWLRGRTEASVGSTRSSVVASDRSGPFAAIVGASLEDQRFYPMSASFTPLPNEDGGRRNNSDRRDGSVAAKATVDLNDENRLIVTGSRFEGTFGVPPGTKDFSVRYWRWSDWYSTALGAGHQYRGHIVETEELAYVSLVGNTLDGYDDARYRTQLLPRALHSVYDDMSVGTFVRTTITPRTELPVRLRGWAGFKRDMHASFDNTNPEKVHVATNLITLAATGEVEPLPRRLRATAGVQSDSELPDRAPAPPADSSGVIPPRVSPDASTAVAPMSGLTWFASDAFTLSLNATSRTRFPTLKERFSTSFGTRDPNPKLRPERAVNLGIDAAVRATKMLRIAVGLFDSEVRDLVTTVIVAPQTEQLQNIGRARFLGVEGQIEWAPTRWLEVLAGGLAMRAKSGENLGDAIASTPGTKGLGMLTVRPLAKLSFSAIGRAIGPQQYQNPNTGVWERLDGYGLLDARAEYRVLPQLRVWLRATNLFDANVEARYSFPEAGRQAFIGLLGETP